MKKLLPYYQLLTVLFIFLFSQAPAAVESVTSSLSGNLNAPIQVNRSVLLQDQWYPFPAGWSSIFRVKDATANVVLRYDDSKRTYTDKRWQIDVEYTIKQYDASGTLTTSTGETLTIDYDPREGLQYTDRDMRQYSNTHVADVTITGLTYSEWSPASATTPTTASTIPSWLDDVYFDVEINVERYYNLTTAITPTLTLTENTGTNELDVTWNYIQGAESYDLEWLFIDAGNTTGPFTGSYNYDWRNASRVNVPDQHYSIPLAFPKGILLVRLRGVGIDWDNYVTNSLITRGDGDWTSGATTGSTSSYSGYRFDIINGLLPGMNWAYSAGFAEDGKRMDGAQFYDGLMRGRESVLTVNSDGTVMVSDGAYDFEGRPAVSFLPYPATSEGIKFYDGNQNYDCQSFDQDGNINDPDPMGPSNGSASYYSAIGTTATGISGNTAEANQFPFTRVTYMSDGTNRPATSSGAGETLKQGGGYETKYFYGTPTQHQLDRLFGNEVGYATHYKKNFVIDANGVVSVSYVDQHGRVIATALAGNTPDNLVSIDNPNGNPNTSVNLTDDLLVNNTERQSGDGKESEFTITVTETSEHDFTYSVGTVCYGDVCYTTCENCHYDLVIMLTTPSGDSIDINTASSEYAIRYSDIVSGTYTFTITLDPGTYRLTKTLTLNQAHLDEVRQTYIDYQLAHPTGTDCIPVIDPNPVPCAGDCHTACENHYLVNGVYVDDDGVALEDQGTASTDPGPMLIAACQKELCDQPKVDDPCTLKYNAMLEDMSPGGQYFDNTPYHFTVNSTTGLQSINATYESTGTYGVDYSSGDINDWMDANVTLSAFNTLAGTSYDTWEEVRQNWDPDWASLLVAYHPEYCAWNYFCGWSCEYTYSDPSPPGATITDTLDASDSYSYEMATMYSTDGNYSGSDGYYWNPLNVTTSTVTVTPDVMSTSSDNSGYIPKGNGNVLHGDPRFAGSCDIEICSSSSTYAEATLQNYLTNFMPAYDENDVFIGYFSAWYVALDPNNIAGGGYNSDLNAATLAVFTDLHGTSGLISSTPSADQITPYQFFRSVYFYYRTLVIEQGFAGDAAVASCQSARSGLTPAYDSYGYLAGSTDNPTITPQGFTILYPQNPLIAIYGDGCDTPTMGDIATIIGGLVDDAAENPDNINLTVPTNDGCSCQMLQDFIDNHDLGVSPTSTEIATALNDEYGTSYTYLDVEAWQTACSEHTALTDFPEALTCELDNSIEDVSTAVQTNCEQENLDLATYNAYVTYQNQLNAAADAYMAAYVNKCVKESSESFEMNYDLHEYYYTLYYYDQAGNLVKTVPPEGVNIIDLVNDDLDGDGTKDGVEITTYRNDFRDGTITPSVNFTPAKHDMKSLYAYNSLQQPISAKQNNLGNGTTYESGETSFWYDYLGRLVVSQNSKQAAMSPPAYSYTRYDDLGRIYEVGEIHTTATLTTTASSTGSRDNSGQYYFFDIDHVANPTALDDFLNGTYDAYATRNDVTSTYYDEAWSGTSSDVSSAFGTAGQENLRNRVSAVVYDDDPAASSDLYGFSVAGQPGHLSAFYYSYDIHGNVKTVVQETPPLKTHNQNVKTTTYEYDLISGNVNAVHYQSGQRDEFHHKYEYDADNRLHASYSSRDGVTWEKESKQFYYETGGMGRVEIGDKTVQGLDYVYTINGWFKGMNRNTIGNYGDYMSRDIGQDAGGGSNLNANVGADAAGFTLDYFAGDYTAVNTAQPSFEADKTSTAYGSAIKPQYNGNIAGMVTSMQDNAQLATEVQGRAFTYDQLYRLKQSLAFHMDGTALSANAWQTSYTQDNRYREDFSYDWNGNIKTVQRYTGNVSGSGAVKSDDLTYHYAANSNILTYITDAQSACSYDDDIDDQPTTNYSYDLIGALTADVSERITGIDWNPYGKMKAVHKDQANNTNACTSTEYDDADVEYLYTAGQQRLCKIVKPHKAGGAGISDQSDWEYTWYMYDAGGMVMAVYDQSFRPNGSDWTVNFDLEEHDVYGSGRLGIRHGDDEGKYHQDFSATITSGLFDAFNYSGASAAYAKEHCSRTIGLKQYEVANHLGNVLVTVSDKRLAQDNYHYTLVGLGSDYSYNADLDAYYYTPGAGVYAQTSGADGELDWYTPDVLSYSDYYAFGAPQTGRNGGDGYRYGFNGKENDDEVKGVKGSHQDYGLRMYDPRVGRFFSADPLMFAYPYYTPYQFAGNMPISATDLDGGEPKSTNEWEEQKVAEINGVSYYNVYHIDTETGGKRLEFQYSVDANGHVTDGWGSLNNRSSNTQTSTATNEGKRQQNSSNTTSETEVGPGKNPTIASHTVNLVTSNTAENGPLQISVLEYDDRTGVAALDNTMTFIANVNIGYVNLFTSTLHQAASDPWLYGVKSLYHQAMMPVELYKVQSAPGFSTAFKQGMSDPHAWENVTTNIGAMIIGEALGRLIPMGPTGRSGLLESEVTRKGAVNSTFETSSQAFRAAKRDLGIPCSEQYVSHTPVQADRFGNPGVEYQFKNGQKIQWHPYGHPEQGVFQPHYNIHDNKLGAFSKNHYFYMK